MRYDLLLATILGVLVTLAETQAQEKKPDGSKALDYFVGVWNTEVTDKPAKGLPAGGKRTLKESTMRILKDRFILSREVSQPDGGKSLWLTSYDQKTNTYPAWIFNNKGLIGGEWSNTWDEAAKTFTGKATDTPQGWTSGGKYHFADKNSCLTTFWMKDESKTLLHDLEAKKVRQPENASEKVLAAWSKLEKANTPLPPEMKVLERLVGSWDVVGISRPAAWNPKEVRTTSKVTRKWVMDGHFLQDTTETSDGQEMFSLMTFDPQMKKYRSWWFSSEGQTNKLAGDWDEATDTISFKADLDDKLAARNSVRLTDKDRHVVKMVIKDGDGKLYFDGEWTVTRRNE